MLWLLLALRILLALALYLFLGAVLLALWRGLRSPAQAFLSAPRVHGRLVVVAAEGDAGESPALAVGTTFPLQAINSLGRSPLNTIVIPDVYASSEHALLLYRGGQWWLEDRGSRNGTTVNTVPINGPTIVSPGEVIGIGRVKLRLESTFVEERGDA